MEMVWLALSAGACYGLAHVIQRRRKRREDYLLRGQFHQAPIGELGTDEQRLAALRDNPFVRAELDWARQGTRGRGQ